MLPGMTDPWVVSCTAAAAAARAISFAMLRLFWFFHVEAALFAAADAAMRPQPFQNHLRGGSGRTSVFAIVSAKPGDVLHQTLNLAKLLAALGGRRKFGQLQLATQLEPLNHRLEIHVGEMLAEHAPERGSNQFARNDVRAFQLAFIFQFHLSGDRRECGVDIRGARNGVFLSDAGGPLFGAAYHAFERGYWQPLAHTRAAVHAFVFACLKRNLFHHFPQVCRYFHFAIRVTPDPRVL